MTAPAPTLEVEAALARRLGDGPRIVVGVDEVGRGALAGPVAVGACALRFEDGHDPVLPEGVRDSKKLTAKRREALVGPVREAALASAVGWASPAEIDEIGILPALTRAALRALTALDVAIDAILLDGDVDVLTPALAAAASGTGRPVPQVELRVAADRDCASVSAASILAKVARDARMVELDALAPDYGWASNKGYGAAAHREAIDRLGAHEHHRRSWRLGSAPTPAAQPAARRPARPAAATTGPAARAGRVPAPVLPAPPIAPRASAAAPALPGVLWDDQWHPQDRKERP